MNEDNHQYFISSLSSYSPTLSIPHPCPCATPSSKNSKIFSPLYPYNCFLTCFLSYFPGLILTTSSPFQYTENEFYFNVMIDLVEYSN